MQSARPSRRILPRPAAAGVVAMTPVLAAIASAACIVAPAVAQPGRVFIGTIDQWGSSADDQPVMRSARWQSGPFYYGGSTQGTLGAAQLGGWDVFIRRQASGPQWTIQFGSDQDDFALALDHDALGGPTGAYIAGYTAGAMIPGGHQGGLDAFVARFSTSGERLWLRQFGTPHDDIARDVAHDWQSGFYIGGSTRGDLGGSNAGGADAFLARYDGAGNQLWIRQFGGSGDDAVQAIYPHWTGGAFVAGETAAASGVNIFLARYDGAGTRVWYREFGSGAEDRAHALFVSHAWSDVLYIGGSTTGDLGAANAGGMDAWIASYDLEGTRHWLTQFGTPHDDEVLAVRARFGGVVAGGRTRGDLGSLLSNAGGSDAFLARFDSGGGPLWTTQFGTSADDAVVSIHEDLVIGYTDGQLGPTGGGNRDMIHFYAYEEPCYPDCDHSNPPPMLNVDDFTCFINTFALATSLSHIEQVHNYANCDGSTVAPVLNIDDFTCFINQWALGCW
jgi:hypothetical protein